MACRQTGTTLWLLILLSLCPEYPQKKMMKNYVTDVAEKLTEGYPEKPLAFEGRFNFPN